MARHTKPSAPATDPPERHFGGDELFRLMSELVSLREKVTQAELTRSRSAPASSGGDEAAN
jgi:hypothetical protein